MLKLSAALLFAAAAASAAHATPVTENTWYEFAFTTVGTPATGCSSGNCMPSSGTPSTAAGNPPYTISLTGTDTLLVQDAFLPGDAFAIFDSGNRLGATPNVPGSTFYSCDDDPVICSADPAFSKGAFLLGAGDHSLSFAATESVINTGAAYFEIVPGGAAVTPEPSSLALLGTGLLGVTGMLRRRSAAI